MKRGVRLLWILAVAFAGAWAQEPGYPITVIPPGKGSYQFPQGYQTPWEKIEMLEGRQHFTLDRDQIGLVAAHQVLEVDAAPAEGGFDHCAVEAAE